MSNSYGNVDERLQQFNALFAEDYASWDDVSREDLLYYLRVLLIEKEIPKHIAPFGDGLPGCLLLVVSWLRSLFQVLWQNAGEMCDPENYEVWRDG